MPSTKQTIERIQAGALDSEFARLYAPGPEVAQTQRTRYVQTILEFEETFGPQEEISIYSVPGRTEIGGNHTDHNHGLVMAAAVNLNIIAVVCKTNDGFATVKSKGFGEADNVDLAYLEPVNTEFGKSAGLIRGVAAGIAERGGRTGGFNAYTTSDVLRGSGLSSSAAFEVCMGQIMNTEYNEGRFTAVELGQIGQFAENKFFGKPSGLMDQTACAVGGAITIDFKDAGNPVVREVPFDLGAFGFKLVITDTKGDHANLTAEYAAVRQEMERVAAFFDKKTLRDVDRETFMASLAALRLQTGDRAVLRAIHFYEECRRVTMLAQAVEAGRFGDFLALITESGHSSFEYNQNAYNIANPAHQGVPLGLALSQLVLAGHGAWRLQGGGFAGTIQAFVPNQMLEQYCTALQDVFGADACHVLLVRGPGAVKLGGL